MSQNLSVGSRKVILPSVAPKDSTVTKSKQKSYKIRLDFSLFSLSEPINIVVTKTISLRKSKKPQVVKVVSVGGGGLTGSSRQQSKTA